MKFKKVICLLLIMLISINIISCEKNNQQEVNNEINTNFNEADVDKKENDEKNNSKINNSENEEQIYKELQVTWYNLDKYSFKSNPIEIPNIKANVTPYTIKEDLSNIENINNFNGFTDEQKKMLAKNGFIILPATNTKVYYTYDRNEYNTIPNFITTDSVLHMYHQLYSKSLIYIEKKYLIEELSNLTNRMLEKSIELSHLIQKEDLKTISDKNIVFFTVAKMLLEDTSNISVEINDELFEIAKKEFELISNAEGFDKSPLFETDLDYSQFIVRGHYTRSEDLSRYFKTMMWYGFSGIYIIDENGEYDHDKMLQAMLMTYTFFIEYEGKYDAEIWEKIYYPTALYVGMSDDLTIYDIKNVIINVFGESPNINDFNEEEFIDEIQKEVDKLPEPKIKGKFTEINTPTGKQLRFMGQRYILDGYIMQELMEPLKWPIPSALDVMGVLGSNVAEEYIFNEIQPQNYWPEYENKYAELKNEVNSYDNDMWSSNLYNGWLWCLQSNFKEFDKDSGMPFFMTNDSWKYKSLNTSLGSFAELKHDTVLYGKQPAAEMGGPIELADEHYVEPNIELYSKLLWLLDYTYTNLKNNNMLNENFEKGVIEFKEVLELLIDCSIKELNNEPLSEEQKSELLWYGGTLESISNNLSNGTNITDDTSFISNSCEMVVSDIATIAPNSFSQGGYLENATGYFDEIYVVVPVEGKLYLTRGSVYSYYEFMSNERLTDEKWWEMLGIEIIKEDYGNIYQIGEPSKNLPGQPKWINNIKSYINEVQIIPSEVDWDALNE